MDTFFGLVLLVLLALCAWVGAWLWQVTLPWFGGAVGLILALCAAGAVGLVSWALDPTQGRPGTRWGEDHRRRD